MKTPIRSIDINNLCELSIVKALLYIDTIKDLGLFNVQSIVQGFEDFHILNMLFVHLVECLKRRRYDSKTSPWDGNLWNISSRLIQYKTTWSSHGSLDSPTRNQANVVAGNNPNVMVSNIQNSTWTCYKQHGQIRVEMIKFQYIYAACVKVCSDLIQGDVKTRRFHLSDFD